MNSTDLSKSILCFISLLLMLLPENYSDARDMSLPAKLQGYGLSIQIEQDLISLHANDVPIEDLIKELGQKLRVEISFNGGGLATAPLSSSFSNLPLHQALERILRAYSYAINYEAENRIAVTILSSQGVLDISPVKVGDAIKENGFINSALSVSPVHPPGKVETGPKYFSGREEGSSSRKECEQMDLPDGGQEVLLTHAGLDEKQTVQEREKTIKEARIQRAERVLQKTECSYMWERVVRELADIQDERVIPMLSEIAQRGPEPLRGEAARSLWHNTAVSAYKNTQGLSALGKLVASPDPFVSMWARQALQDYEVYRKKSERATPNQ